MHWMHHKLEIKFACSVFDAIDAQEACFTYVSLIGTDSCWFTVHVTTCCPALLNLFRGKNYFSSTQKFRDHFQLHGKQQE